MFISSNVYIQEQLLAIQGQLIDKTYLPLFLNYRKIFNMATLHLIFTVHEGNIKIFVLLLLLTLNILVIYFVYLCFMIHTKNYLTYVYSQFTRNIERKMFDVIHFVKDAIFCCSDGGGRVTQHSLRGGERGLTPLQVKTNFLIE